MKSRKQDPPLFPHTHTHSCDSRDLSSYTGDSEGAKTHGLLPRQREIPLALFLDRQRRTGVRALAESRTPHEHHNHTLSHHQRATRRYNNAQTCEQTRKGRRGGLTLPISNSRQAITITCRDKQEGLQSIFTLRQTRLLINTWLYILFI